MICHFLPMAATSYQSGLTGDAKSVVYNALLKAKRGGFQFKNFIDSYDSFVISSFNPVTGRMALVLRNEQVLRVVYDSIYTIFFDTSFARAFFGGEWEKHLVDLAAASDKLEYLSNHLAQTEYHG